MTNANTNVFAHQRQLMSQVRDVYIIAPALDQDGNPRKGLWIMRSVFGMNTEAPISGQPILRNLRRLRSEVARCRREGAVRWGVNGTNV